MSDFENPPTGGSAGPDDEQIHDQDSEPTMNAPQEGRPDGLDALDDDTDSDTDVQDGEGSPS